LITAAVRTPIGRAGGALAEVRPDDLAAVALRGVLARAGLPLDRVDDVLLGCANQAGEDNRNVARMAALLAGLPVEVPGQTVNRLCGSGLQAVASAAQAVAAREGDVFLAGGVESMTRAPYVTLKSGGGDRRRRPWRIRPSAGGSPIRGSGPSGSSLGKPPRWWRAAIGREAQDRFAPDIAPGAGGAAAGAFDDELVPVE
jgi:acetyl-CoA acetyltransferase